MSRFVNPAATKTVDLGPCDCPGTPHEGDWAKVRTELSGSEIAALGNARQTEAAAAEAVAPLVLEWNLLDPDGDEWPPTPDGLRLLTAATLNPIVEAIQEAVAESSRLPNSSSAPSPASSRGSASRTRNPIPKPGT